MEKWKSIATILALLLVLTLLVLGQALTTNYNWKQENIELKDDYEELWEITDSCYKIVLLPEDEDVANNYTNWVITCGEFENIEKRKD